MRVSTASNAPTNSVRAEHLIAALIRHTSDVSPQQAFQAAKSIAQEFSLQPRNYGSLSTKKTGKGTKKSKPSKSKGMSNTGFAHVHAASGDIGTNGVDLTIQQNSVDWGTQGSHLVINLSRKQCKRLRAVLDAYLYSTQGSGDNIEQESGQFMAA